MALAPDTLPDMIRPLSGMKYCSFEYTCDTLEPLHKSLKVIQKHIKAEYPWAWLSSMSFACDPYDEDKFVYTVVLSF